MNIKDIANLAGVSVSTVSKIVNKKDQSISKETRERVLKIVHEYNYTPYSSSINKAASTGIIGVLINSTISADSMLNGIINEAQRKGYSPLILNSCGDLDQELKNMTSLITKQVDGIIWEPVNKESLKNRTHFNSLDIPVVLVGGEGQANSLELPYKLAAYFLTKQLIDKKHTKIACIVGEGQRRNAFIEGYKHALFDSNLKFQESMVLSSLDETINDFIIGGQTTGFISSHLYKSIELYNLAIQSGLKSPKDYSLLSIQNDYDSSLVTDQGTISTVTINNSNFGTYICNVLISSIAGADPIKPYEEQMVLDNTNTLGFPDEGGKPKILVVGSINMDTYLYSPQLPHNGATNFISSFTKHPGGKGFNQAVGTAKLGHRVRLIGCLGSDMESNSIFQDLEKNGVSTIGITRSSDTETGQAYIFVESSGDSMISVLPGANADLSPQKIEQQTGLFSDAKFCLIQTEIPVKTVEKACSIAKNEGLSIILKPSASKIISDTILKQIDYLIPNEDELLELCPQFSSIEQKADFLLSKGVKNVIVTLGKKGCYLKNAEVERFFPASEFAAVDSTGASDAFISALASYLLRGCSLVSAIQIATIAAGFSVSRDGVIHSLADRVTLESYIAKKDPKLLLSSH
ncbi:PfkB family carbohydrate kinase [Paenibacillus solani]|uniref:Ribokinase n=1 Tax=Paenibacillus solani TaxID=1705565 RepID=A0A0M1P0M0_9BACL|nr:PfkB family carbohydrate kinase [Paenibacillus solani]KOR88048.1 ribokinase [Paenibacillus solani]